MTRSGLAADEHAAFVAAVTACFAEHAGPAAVRALLDDPRGDDPALRDRAVRELGLPGLLIDEVHGGAGVELGLLADVLAIAGRRLVGGPLLPTAIATLVVDRLGHDDDRAALLPPIAAGERTAALALHDDLRSPVTFACRRPSRVRLSGTRTAVVDGLHADQLLVPVRSGERWLVTLVAADADGLSRRALPPFDLTRRIAELRFADTPAVVLGEQVIEDEAWQRVLDIATVLVAADATGAAAEAADRAVAYAGERQQFGRPIGSFQAVKHRLARAHVDVESAHAAIEHAVSRLAGPADDAPEGDPDARVSTTAPGPRAAATALAGLRAFRVAAEVTRDAIQVHGGIGFTWEHDAQLFHRRALADAAMLRPTAELERRLVAASVAGT
ncbi:MAG: acyl-CoA/acyl-ACP dehydrogenase [Patulibacter sp.]|nr:acyl-CoA/acyl-ACP dehydrogenase [Patulibacter sp.]